MKKLFHIRFWLPRHWFFFRLAFPTGVREGEWYDISTDSMRVGRHIKGVMMECGWRKGHRPSGIVHFWSTPAVPHREGWDG